MGIYETLGVKHVINADARLTRLGGSLMPEPVLQAMREAARSYVDMFELQQQVGRRLAALTNNQAAYVATGAAAGLFLSTLACMLGPERLGAIPWPAGADARDEVIIHRAQRIPYDLAVRQAGARLVEIGTQAATTPAELDAAIGARTAAVLFIAGAHLSQGALPLAEVLRIAHARSVPVIVDAAAQLPPPENLWRFTREYGADLAIFSGGKDLCGPQASGLVLGRPDLIAACQAHGAPHQRLGRPMKVGKEELLGLLAAVELYLQHDHAARIAGFERTVAGWIDTLGRLPGLVAERAFPNEAGQPTPRLLLRCDPAVCGMSGAELREQLWAGDPSIAVAAAGTDGIFMSPDLLEPGQEQLIVERIVQLLAGAARPPAPR